MIYIDINNEKFTQDEFLYGKGVVPPSIPDSVVKERIRLLENHLEVLLDHTYYDRDTMRVRAILKAIKFWGAIDG
jgi:hypothetical protein